jgi:hypothetical protein
MQRHERRSRHPFVSSRLRAQRESVRRPRIRWNIFLVLGVTVAGAALIQEALRSSLAIYASNQVINSRASADEIRDAVNKANVIFQRSQDLTVWLVLGVALPLTIIGAILLKKKQRELRGQSDATNR